MAKKFKSVTLYAEHQPETHRSINPDRSVSEVELPGFLEVGVSVDGVRVKLARVKAGGFLDDLRRSKSSGSPDEG